MTLPKQYLYYLILVAIVIGGLTTSNVIATKVVHFGIDFPASNIIYAVFTYPFIDSICELWGKRLARFTILLALGCQIFVAALIRLVIALPAAQMWHLAHCFDVILSASTLVVVASLTAFTVGQLLDIFVFRKIKQACNGRQLWLRTNVSNIASQLIDSAIFVSIVFHNTAFKLDIIGGSFVIKIIASIAMTPVVYGIVLLIDHLLDHNTLAFKKQSG